MDHLHPCYVAALCSDQLYNTQVTKKGDLSWLSWLSQTVYWVVGCFLCLDLFCVTMWDTKICMLCSHTHRFIPMLLPSSPDFLVSNLWLCSFQAPDGPLSLLRNLYIFVPQLICASVHGEQPSMFKIPPMGKNPVPDPHAPSFRVTLSKAVVWLPFLLSSTNISVNEAWVQWVIRKFSGGHGGKWRERWCQRWEVLSSSNHTHIVAAAMSGIRRCVKGIRVETLKIFRVGIGFPLYSWGVRTRTASNCELGTKADWNFDPEPTVCLGFWHMCDI